MRKDDFPILLNTGMIYLDNSATSQKPQQVIEAITHFYENSNANVHRGIYRLSQQATVLYEKAHEIVGTFIGASPDEIIFTSGTTDSLNLLARSLSWNLQNGDEIVLTEMEHHSNLVPWQQIAKERGAVLKFIPVTAEYYLDMKKARELITSKTKIVSVVHISNVLGTINPVHEIAQLAHEVGAVCVVDAAQSVPHLPINVQELDCDFLAFSGHKMCGPTGIGVLYGKKELLRKLVPSTFGGGMIREVSFNDATWADVPAKFEAGTPNIAGAVGLAAAIEYLQTIGMKNIWQHTHSLTEYALTKLSAIEGVTIIGPPAGKDRGAVISFTMNGLHPHDVSELLDKENIAVRGGHHCAMPLMKKLGVQGTTRASLYLYTTKEDVDAFVNVIQNIVSVGSIDKDILTIDNLTEEQEIYKENILDHYKNPRNKKELTEAAVISKEVNPLCGDEITLYLDIEEGKIVEAAFTGKGCVISQASASLFAEYVNGLTVEEVQELQQRNILDLLKIPISHTRLKCALLPLRAFQKGMEVPVC